MTKSIVLACSFVAFTAVAWAQTSPSPEAKAKPADPPVASAASPLVVSSSRKLDLDAKEPKGLLLKMDGPKPGYLRVEWGATRQALSQAMASLSGQPADGVLRCSEQGVETLCFPSGEISWSGVFGKELSHGELSPGLLFSPKGELYHYILLLPADRMDPLLSAVKADLGTPTRDGNDPRMALWNLGHVSVVVQQSPMGSQVHVVYVPIAETTQ